MSRTLLLLNTTFFPDPLVQGVRVTQWSKHLPTMGWRVHVLCRYYGWQATRVEMGEHVHPDVQVEYLNPPSQAATTKRTPRPTAAPRPRAKLGKTSLGRLSVPDLSVWFWRKVRQQVLRRLEELKPDAILTSGPPHSVHDLGLWLHRKAGVPWVADFRDPYLMVPAYQPRGPASLVWPAHKRFERRVYQHAGLLTHAIPFHARWARLRYPFARPRIRILENGIPDDLAEGRIEPFPSPTRRLNVRAVGVIGEQAVVTLARAISRLTIEDFDLEFRHSGRPPSSADEVTRVLGDRAVFTGLVPHHEALRQVAGADVVIKADDPERSQLYGVSSKLFEYLATGRPLIVVNPSKPDAQLLRDKPWVQLLCEPNVNELTAALRHSLRGEGADEQWLSGFRQRYNRRNQAQRLAGWLDELVG